MAGYNAGRNEVIYHSRLFPGIRNLSHQRWLMRGRKRHFQLFCQTMSWKTITTRMNADFFISTFQIKLTSWNEKSVRKLSKIHITGMAAANAMEDKLPKFVIGKAKNPRCFKSVKFLPCWYRNQRKSWMDGNLFAEWLKELDRKFLFEGRNVDFVIDNCPVHPHIDNLKAIKFYFLSHNSTSKTQPMDQGIIYSL